MSAKDMPDLPAVERFDAIVKEMRAVADEYDRVTERAHAALKDLGAAMREARDEVQKASRDAVRKYLAKEAETIAARLREEMKR